MDATGVSRLKLAPHAATLKAKLDYRKGYFAPTIFAKMRESDKEAQLQQALESENPITDLPIAVEIDYFRLDKANTSCRFRWRSLVRRSRCTAREPNRPPNWISPLR